MSEGKKPAAKKTATKKVAQPAAETVAAAAANVVAEERTERQGVTMYAPCLVNLRAAPGVESAIVGTLEAGQTVTASEDVESGYIRLTNPEGWAALRFLKSERP